MQAKVELPPEAQQFFDALVAEDEERFMAVYGPDVVWFPGSPDWFVPGLDNARKSWGEWFADPPAHFTSWRWIDGPYGERTDDLIWAWGILEATFDNTATPPVKGVVQNKRVSWIWRGSGEDWRLAAEHWSRPRRDDYLSEEALDPEMLRYKRFGE